MFCSPPPTVHSRNPFCHPTVVTVGTPSPAEGVRLVGQWLPGGHSESPSGCPSFHQVSIQFCSLCLPLSTTCHWCWCVLVEALDRFGRLLLFEVRGILGCLVDSMGLLLLRAYLVSGGFHLLSLSAYFASPETSFLVAIAARWTHLNKLTPKRHLWQYPLKCWKILNEFWMNIDQKKKKGKKAHK